MMHRRSFLLGLGALMAAPAIVKASSLMPVKQMVVVEPRRRMISGSLDSMTRTVRWYYKSGELRIWMDEALYKLDEKDLAYAEQHDDYFKQVDQTIKLAGENPDFDNMVLEPFKLPSIQSGESLKDLKYNKELWGNGPQNELVYRGLI
jgi:hypothetical protein